MSPPLHHVRAVIFDVDGVLLDARPSYWAVAEEGARRAVAGLLGEAVARTVPFEGVEEIARFKAAGRFNDDWEMSRGIALLLWLRATGQAPELAEFLASANGRGVEGLFERDVPASVRATLEPRRVARLCGALYGGDRCRELFGFDAREAIPDAPSRGLWENETVLPERQVLRSVAERFPLALYTGRNPGEARLALTLCGLTIEPSRQWVADGRPRKPDPTGLLQLCSDLAGGGDVLFVGDTADDQAAARGAQHAGARLIYAHVEQPGDTTRVLVRLLAEAGERR